MTQHVVARASALMRDTPVETATSMPQRDPDDADAVRRLKDENLNLRIDNRAKESVIAELTNPIGKYVTL